MYLRIVTIFLSTVVLYSCASLSIDKRVEVNTKEDWLMIGGNPEKTNISGSPDELNPPFSLFWQYNVEGGLAKNALSVSDAILFAATLSGEFYSLDVLSGKSLGKTSAMGQSSFSTPLVFNNNIIIASSGNTKSKLFSYNLINGKIKWQRNIKWVESSPIMINENIVVSNTDGEIFKLNAVKGTIIWKSKIGKHLCSFYTSPTILNEMIFLGSNDGNLYAFDIKNGKELWKFKTNASIFCDASVYNDKIYFGSDDKYFYCLDTLGNLKWKKYLDTKYLSSPTFYKNMVIISGIDGNIYSLDSANGEGSCRINK